jgi:hypothetical protein
MLYACFYLFSQEVAWIFCNSEINRVVNLRSRSIIGEVEKPMTLYKNKTSHKYLYTI